MPKYTHAADDIYRLTITSRLGLDTIMQNTFHAAKAGQTSTPSAVLSALIAFMPDYRTILTTGISVIRLSVENVFTKAYADDEPVGFVGTSYASEIPSSVSVVMQLRTAFRGRWNAGRMYLPAPGAADITRDQLSTGSGVPKYATFVNAFMAQWTGATPTSGFNAVVYTKGVNANAHHGAIPSGAEDVTVAKIDRILRNQRRRQLGVGS